MGKSLAYKILEKHLVSGEMKAGNAISIKIDQTLTQDATGTMVYLQFESMGIKRVQTELSVSYVDHNTLQSDYKNMDDHKFLQSFAKKYGLYFSRPRKRDLVTRYILKDSEFPERHSWDLTPIPPTGGGLGMIAIGAGGLDIDMRNGRSLPSTL